MHEYYAWTSCASLEAKAKTETQERGEFVIELPEIRHSVWEDSIRWR